MTANLKVITGIIRSIEKHNPGEVSATTLGKYQKLLDGIKKRPEDLKKFGVNKYVLDELQGLIHHMQEDDRKANEYLRIALNAKGEHRFVSTVARQWEHDYKDKQRVDATQHSSEDAVNAHPASYVNSQHTQKKDYSWLGWVIGIGFAIFILFNISTSSRETVPSQNDKEHVAQEVINDMDSKYGDLADVATKMIQDMDNECVWLSDNISESIGDYCSDATLSNYADINSASFASINYNKDDDVDVMVSDMVDQGNQSYNELLQTAQESSDSISEECDWLNGNVSSGVGDFCNDINSDFEGKNFSSDPFSSSDYSYLYDAKSN